MIHKTLGNNNNKHMSEPIFDFPEDNFKEVIIIGGGPSALAASARLCEQTPGAIFSDGEHQRFHWLKRRGAYSNKLIKGKKKERQLYDIFKADDIMVLDKCNDSFLGQWDNQFDVVQIPHLRSPMFFHPDPLDIDSLVAFAYSQNRANELMEITRVVGQELSKHIQKKIRSKRRKNSASSKESHGTSGYVEIDQRNWKDYYRPGTPLFRDFCASIIKRYSLENIVKKAEVIDIQYGQVNKICNNGIIESGKGFQVTTSDGEIFGCKVLISAIGATGKINYPVKMDESLESNKFPEGSCHTTHLFSRQVEFIGPEIKKKIKESKDSIDILIVGGGLTSAQLTELALRRGVRRVHFVTRGELKIKHFDFHLEWVTKYQNFMKSTFWMLDTDEERYQMIDDARQGGSVNPQYHKVLMNLIKEGKVILYKHSEIVDKEWDDSKSNWKIIEVYNKKLNKTHFIPNIEYIYFATGISTDFERLPMVKNIISHHPINFVKGVPSLTDELQWNSKIPFFLIGKYAMLKVGPSSANLDGGRIGAERIGWYVQKLKEMGKLEFKETSYNGDSFAILDSNSENESETSRTELILDTEATSDSSRSNSVDDEEIIKSLQNLPKEEISKDISQEALKNGFNALLICTSGNGNWYNYLEQDVTE